MVCVQNALSSLQASGETSLLPLSDIALTLQECRKSKDFQRAQHIHLQLCHHGLEAHESLGNRIVPMLSECGCLQYAQNTFNKLTFRNEHTWTSLMQGYLDSGEPQLALSLYKKMQDDGVLPSEYTFVPLLKSCCILNCKSRSNELQSEIIQRGFESDIVLSNALLDLYVKCYTMKEAHQLFDLLPHHDVITWNTLMAGYIDQGCGEDVHILYKQLILTDGTQPDACTFVCILSYCTKSRDIHLGQEIHEDMVKEGFEECSAVASKLVDFYAQCGLLEEAQDVFDQLPAKNEVIWTALIAGHAEHGPSEIALKCYEDMQFAGVSPDAVTLVCILKACGCLEAIDKGREIHSQIVKQEGCCDPFLGNSLVCMYAKCGTMMDSKKEFDMLQQRDVVAWTALIAGYAECGCSNEALECFDSMQCESTSPNAATFTCVMQVCTNTCALTKGQEVYNEIVKRGFETDVAICNIVLNFYINFGLLEEAQSLFDTVGAPDVSSWHVLIAGYAEHGLAEDVFACLAHMRSEALSPSAAIYACCLSFCANSLGIKMGFLLHGEVLKRGLEREYSVGSALLEMYAKCCSLADLDNVFYKLPERCVAMWNIRIQVYVDHGLCEEALSCLEHMYMEGVLPDIVSWNMLVLGFVEIGQSIKSLDLFLQMQVHGLPPDGVMLVSILKACGEIAAIEFGKRVHALSCGVAELEGNELHNALIDMYGKCGNMRLAQEVFDLEESKTLVTWNALLAGYTRHGASTLVFLYFKKMRACGIEPDEITFLSLLTECSHAGSLGKGQEWFKAMVMEFPLSPNVKHYTCMIDQSGRAGHIEEVMVMVDNMPLHPDRVILDMVLGSCQKQGNTDVGRQVFNSLVPVDENSSAALVLLSNIYANAIPGRA